MTPRSTMTPFVLLLIAASTYAQVTPAFTYQGRVKQDGQLVNDTCTLEFALFDLASGGIALETIPAAPVPLTEGLFTTTIDPQIVVLDGQQQLWIEARIQCPGDVGFTAMEPRQELTASPLSTYALSAAPGSSLDAPDGNPLAVLTVENNGGVRLNQAVDDAQRALKLNNTANDASLRLWMGADQVGRIQQHGAGPGDGDIAINPDGAGRVGIGIAAPQAKLHVDGGNAWVSSGASRVEIGGGGALEIYGSTPLIDFHADNDPGDLTARIIQFTPTGPLTFNSVGGMNMQGPVDVAGDLTATGIVSGMSCCPSDARFKGNITSIGSALAVVAQLRGVVFDWKRSDFPDKKFPTGRQSGFIAQELKEIIPDAVIKRPDGYYSVIYDRVIPFLVEGVKELKSIVDEKDACIAEQNREISELNERVHRLEAMMEQVLAATEDGQ